MKINAEYTQMPASQSCQFRFVIYESRLGLHYLCVTENEFESDVSETGLVNEIRSHQKTVELLYRIHPSIAIMTTIQKSILITRIKTMIKNALTE